MHSRQYPQRILSLPFATFVGSPAGLTADYPTLPEKLRESGYSTKIVGKWHLGYALHESLPTSRGFDEFVGCMFCHSHAYSKQLHRVSPPSKIFLDWMQSSSSTGNITHVIDERHFADIITEESVAAIEAKRDAPLFLFVSHVLNHSPLQPSARSLQSCAHVKHYWRRQTCASMRELDDSIRLIVEAAAAKLGEDTVVIITSDNGGSTWFGGLNGKFRGGKSNPFEGGIHVPALVLDYSTDQVSS